MKRPVQGTVLLLRLDGSDIGYLCNSSFLSHFNLKGIFICLRLYA